jgi:two-component system, chemotaxis family, CheB/CheR fusion protein
MTDTAGNARAGTSPPIVGIGASAGGLEALQQFFRALPADLGAAYVVIVHLAPDRHSDLPGILARETTMPVVQVGDHDQSDLVPNQVYVIAPDRKLELTDSHIGASRFEQPRGQRAAIDLFFRSLCRASSQIFAVLLSGGGSDGSEGAKSVKAAGGLVLVQEPQEAAHASMPMSAIATGAADLVLPVRDIAERLALLIRQGRQMAALLPAAGSEGDSADSSGAAAETGDEADEDALRAVLELLRRRTGHDFTRYKRNTILRRLSRRMQLSHRTGIRGYLTYLEGNVEEVQALFNDLLITVTMFFRDPRAWEELRQRVVAPLVRDARPDEMIRCWVPGCATGEEAYSLAILFGEEMERQHAQINLMVFASDVDERALARAREGVYPSSIAADLSEQRLARWFQPRDDHYRVNAELRDRVVFATHSLQRDPPFSRLNLISCRNLLIYLDRTLQDQVMEIFRYACRDDGYLFLGSSETAREDLFSPLSKQYRIYQAQPAPRTSHSALTSLSLAPGAAERRRHPERPRLEREDAAEQHRLALEERAPPSLLVDTDWQVRHLSERAGRFLEPRGGPATHAATDLVRPELRGELIVALRHAFETAEPWLSEFVPVELAEGQRRVALLVQPRARDDGRAGTALVMFLESGMGSSRPVSDSVVTGSERERVLIEQLHQAEHHIDLLRTEHHAAEEDLRAANEELQSLNEEYRSTTEELETSKEELQSINEELQTVNVELKIKLDEVSRAHDDLENLMLATDIATLFLDRSLCIQRFTPQLSGLFRIKSHDRGRPISDLTHSLDYPALEQDARAVLANLVPLEREVNCADGRAFIARMRPYRTADDRIDGVVLTLLDVSRLKQAEAVLRDSEERFRALVEASAQAVWTTDATGAPQEDSLSWRTFTGQSRDAWLSSGWIGAVHPDEAERARSAWRKTLAEATALNEEFRLYHSSSGSYRWVSVRAVPLLTREGAVRGWVGMNIDVSERKQAEAVLRESDQRKDEFLAMLGHELRNPLAAIRNSVEAATRSATPNGRTAADIGSRALGVIDRQSRHMTRLVNDLLDVTRITRNQLELRRRPVALHTCIDDVVAAARSRIDARQLQLAVDVDPGLVVLADPERVVQIVDNLVLNAVNFTSGGGRISIAAQREAGAAVVSITDTGEGMNPADIEGLFEPYMQAGRSQRSSGLGLGLTLVKRLVQMHGGTITATSDGPGCGSTFSFTLPLAEADATAASATAHPVAAVPCHRVLVVDDEADVADTFAATLRQMGQEVSVAYNAREALELAQVKPPQIAFLDLAMPDVSGEELAEQLRARFSASSLVLVALTGHGTPTGSDQTPFARYLLKPADLGVVAEVLQSVVSDSN